VFGAVPGLETLALRFFGDLGDDRLLIVNMGRDLALETMTEPLLVPPNRFDWTLLWASEDPRYGGSGAGVLDTQQWYFPGHAAVVLKPIPIAP
jgi:maltooligosyltrehalose trehalohydrolase